MNNIARREEKREWRGSASDDSERGSREAAAVSDAAGYASHSVSPRLLRVCFTASPKRSLEFAPPLASRCTDAPAAVITSTEMQARRDTRARERHEQQRAAQRSDISDPSSH